MGQCTQRGGWVPSPRAVEKLESCKPGQGSYDMSAYLEVFSSSARIITFAVLYVIGCNQYFGGHQIYTHVVGVYADFPANIRKDPRQFVCQQFFSLFYRRQQNFVFSHIILELDCFEALFRLYCIGLEIFWEVRKNRYN